MNIYQAAKLSEKIMKNILIVLCVVLLSLTSPLAAADCAGGVCRPAARVVVKVAERKPVRSVLPIRIFRRH